MEKVFDECTQMSRVHRGIVEEGYFVVCQLTSHFKWHNSSNGSIIKIPIYAVKEIRKGKDCQSVRLSWGMTFCLDFIVLKAKDEKSLESIVKQMETAIKIVENSSYDKSFHCHLRNQFFGLLGSDKMWALDKLDRTVIRRFAEKINYEMSSENERLLFYAKGKVRDGVNLSEWLDFVSQEIYHNQKHLLELRLESNPSLIIQYMSGSLEMGRKLLEKFLKTEQKVKNSEEEIKLLLNSPRETLNPRKFLEYLFSERNSVSNHPKEKPFSMERPLSHYWISASHNTYLTGDQFMSESSEEAYVRVLRKGCRCVELDCWPGDDGDIVIFHGNTRTTKISFESVLLTIKNHAFETSPYPLILSIENHCPVDLQKKMAKLFRDTFGNLLLLEPLKKFGSTLPSPSDLMYKIIIKHKKIPKGESEASLSQDDYEAPADASKKAGLLYRWVNDNWKSYMVVLDDSHIYYDPQVAKVKEYVKDDPMENHWTEKWFHGKLEGGIKAGMDIFNLLHEKENGEFLVGIVNDSGKDSFHLFFWHDGNAYYLEVFQVTENCQLFFNLDGMEQFRSISELIENYQYFPIIFPEWEVKLLLTKPVPQINAHEKMIWFHPNLSKEAARAILSAININGSFLVRRSEKQPQNLVLAVWVDNVLKDFKLHRNENGFTFCNSDILFENAVEIIKYFQETPLLSTLLINPIIIESAQRALSNQEEIFSLRENTKIGKEENKQSLQKQTLIETAETNDYFEVGCFDLRGASIEQLLCDYSSSFPFGFRLVSIKGALEFRINDQMQMAEWMKEILKIIEDSKMLVVEAEIKHAIALELSDIVIYCQSAKFVESEHLMKGGREFEIYSHSESKIKALIDSHPRKMLNFHKKHLSRVYPNGVRVTSSNFNPLPFWIIGCQMLALNYQTGDLSMQVNDAWFERNNSCGYVLRPDSHFTDSSISVEYMDPIYIEMTVLGARNLNLPNKKGHQSSTVKIKVMGHSRDMKVSNNSRVDLEGTSLAMSCFSQYTGEHSKQQEKTEKLKFIICYPEYALLRFSVYGKDALTRCVNIGQSIVHVDYLREGYRSVPLKNEYSEKIHLSSLLIHIRTWRMNEIEEKRERLERELLTTKVKGRVRVKKAIAKLAEVKKIFAKEIDGS